MADYALPTLLSSYSDMLTILKDRDTNSMKMFDGTTDSNLPVGTKKWNSTNNYFEKFDGSSWSPLASKYMINVDLLDGCTVNDTGTSSSDLWTASKILSHVGTKLDSSSYTANDVLAKLITVDGIGSGLDADLLDGISPSVNAIPNTIVARDASGNFSASTITGTLNGNASTATKLASSVMINKVAFDGSSSISIENTLGVPITAAATTPIGGAGLGDTIQVVGTTSIVSFGSASAGICRTLIFNNTLTLIHSTNIICPGNSNITTIAGTVINVIAETTNTWRVTGITHPSMSFAKIEYLSSIESNVQAQINSKASLNSPAFVNVPTAPTATVGTNTTQLATTAFSNASANNAIDTRIGVPNAVSIKTAINATGAAPIYACRAWINFNMQSNTIRASGNVSSTTDNGVGDSFINFITSMPSANYAVGSINAPISVGDGIFGVSQSSDSGQETYRFRVNCQTSGGTMIDPSVVTLSFFI